MRIYIRWQDGKTTEITDITDDSAIVEYIRSGSVFDTSQVFTCKSKTTVFNLKLATMVTLFEDDE